MGVRIVLRDNILITDVTLTRDELRTKIRCCSSLFISVTENNIVYDIHIPNIIYFVEI
jgi:hypothetical protein